MPTSLAFLKEMVYAAFLFVRRYVTILVSGFLAMLFRCSANREFQRPPTVVVVSPPFPKRPSPENSQTKSVPIWYSPEEMFRPTR